MEFKTIINLTILLIFYVKCLESVPSFVDEFVHIKVHVPNEVANSRGILKSTYPGSPQHPHMSHKVIHHYHRRRKPFKKSSPPSSAPLLESVILSELDKPTTKEPNHPLEETFVVEEVPSEEKVNTFRVIQETVQKPSHSGYEVTETSPEYNNDHVETYRVVESKDHKNYDYEYEDKPHVESVKLVDEKKNYRYLHHNEDSHFPEYTKKKPRQETIKIIEAAEYKPSEQYKHHTSYHHHDNHDSGESLHYDYKPPHVESLEIIKTKKPSSHDPHSKYYENTDNEDYNHHGYNEETIEIIKTKTSPKYHHSSEHESQDHTDFHPKQKKIIQVEKEIIYTKPREEYENHRGNVKPIYSYPSKDLKPVIEEQIEYEGPSATYKGQQQEYRKPSVIYREYENSRIPSPTRTEHAVYGTKEDLEHDCNHSYHTDHGETYYYHEKSPSTTTQSQKSYYYPSPHREAKLNSDTEEDKTSYRYKTYDAGIQYVTSPQTMPSKDSNPQVSYSPHDGLYDELLPPIVKKPKLPPIIDWPEGVGKTYSTETYAGFDSYSAGHVQGVGSGEYHYSPQR